MQGYSATFKSEFGISQAHGIGLSAPAVSAPVYTATTPGAPAARDVSLRVTRACACGVEQAGQADVVGERAGAGQQPRVFAAPDRRAEDAAAHGRPPIAAAASWTARTMFW
jgi:hypothetical protein